MAKVDHLVVKNAGYTHHGIHLGDGTVVEYGGKGTDRMSVRRVRLDDFRRRGPVFVVRYPAGTALPADAVIQRAARRLNEERYSVLHNNCEHLATWCKTGRHMSPQADNLKTHLLAPVIVGAIAAMGRPAV